MFFFTLFRPSPTYYYLLLYLLQYFLDLFQTHLYKPFLPSIYSHLLLSIVMRNIICTWISPYIILCMALVLFLILPSSLFSGLFFPLLIPPPRPLPPPQKSKLLLPPQIPEYCQRLDEQDVLDNAFDLIFTFDEIVALGYRENVNLAQIRTFTEMDSHEEKVYEAMRKVGREEEGGNIFWCIYESVTDREYASKVILRAKCVQSQPYSSEWG